MAGRENAKAESKVKGEEGEMKQRWSYRRQALQRVERQEQQKRLIILAIILKEKIQVEKQERKDCM